MLKLKVSTSSSAFEQSFESDPILIGGQNCLEADLPLPGIHSDAPLFMIMEANNRYKIIPLMEEPSLLSLNQASLTTTFLNSGDQLRMGDLSIVIEIDPEQQPASAHKDKEFSEEELLSLLASLEQGDALSPANTAPAEKPVATYLNPVTHTFSLSKNKKWVTWFVSCLTILCVGCALLFLYMRQLNNQETLSAAQGVADLGMALSYAHVNASALPDDGLSPAFVKRTLQHLLPAIYEQNSHLLADGTLRAPHYYLRLYTQSPHDLSRFLIIAEPTSSSIWTKWMARKAIILSSETMQLLLCDDLAAWKQALEGPKFLKELSSETIKALARTAEIFPLAQLGAIPQGGFSLPDPAVKPYIYNAPRYHLFTADLSKKILLTAQGEESKRLLNRLAHALEPYENFAHLLLYCSDEPRAAQIIADFVETYLPEKQFLVAHLTLTPSSEAISSVQLLSSHSPFAKASTAPLAPNLTPLLDPIAQAHSLKQLEVGLNQAASLLNPQQFASSLQLDYARRQIRNATLEKVSALILAPIAKAQKFTLSDRQALQSVLSLVDISAPEESAYFLQQFDALLSQQPSTPITLTQLPLPTPLDAPSDEQLKERISQLLPATSENRNHWKEILEARRLMIDSAEARLRQTTQEELGFSANAQAIPQILQTSLSRYIAQKEPLSWIKEPIYYQAQLAQFARDYSDLLQTILEKAATFQERCHTLQQVSTDYIQRLKAYAQDLVHAEADGYLNSYETATFALHDQLEQKLSHALIFDKELSLFTPLLIDKSKGFAMLASSELEQLNNPSMLSINNIEELRQQCRQLTFPELLQSPVARSLQETVVITLPRSS